MIVPNQELNKTPPVKMIFNVDAIMDKIPEEEYEFIENPNDILGLGLIKMEQ